MINNCIQRIMARPGRYAITNVLALMRGMSGYYCAEVDADGRVWQLDPAGKRDGELRPEGWRGDEIVLDPRSIDPNEPGLK